MNRTAALGVEDEEGNAAIWGILQRLGAQRLQYLQARLIKQASRGAAALPFRWERKPKKRSSLAVFFPLGLIWPSRPDRCATFGFEWVYSGPGGSSLRRQQRVLRAR